MSERSRRFALWGAVILSAVVFIGSLGLLIVPPGGVAQLDALMHEIARLGLSLQLARITVVTAFILLGWKAFARWFAHRYAMDAGRVIKGKWRVFAWYLAFEGALVLNFIRIE